MSERRMMTCEAIETPRIAPGWVCCACFSRGVGGTYNGEQRDRCKECGHRRCGTDVIDAEFIDEAPRAPRAPGPVETAVALAREVDSIGGEFGALLGRGAKLLERGKRVLRSATGVQHRPILKR